MNGPHRPTLLVGRTDPTRLRSSLDGNGWSTHDLVSCPGAECAFKWIQSSSPHAVLVELDDASAEAFILRLRSSPEFSHVPVLVLASLVDDLTFARAYWWGADDVVQAEDIDGLTRRLLSIPLDLPHALGSSRGRALLAHGDQKARVLIGRVLRNAGFDVHFATNGKEAAEAIEADRYTLVVADQQLGSPDSTLAVARRGAGMCPWIILARPADSSAVAASTADLPCVAVHDAYAPPETLQFVANEVLSAGFSEQRASLRLLFGTLVAFRTAGRDRDRLGYSYNISAEGMFVRTLDPLPRGDDVWLEFTPPRTDRRVRLEGSVAWSRPIGPQSGSTVPNGFGVRLTGGLTADLRRFSDGYHAFARDLVGSVKSTWPTSSSRP